MALGLSQTILQTISMTLQWLGFSAGVRPGTQAALFGQSRLVFIQRPDLRLLLWQSASVTRTRT